MQETRAFLIQSLSLLFLVSGIAALIDQIIWQRLLFSFFGIDLETVTLVVADFMFGLGIGALVGGWLADRSRNPLWLFAIMEAGVGLFAISSPHLIEQLKGPLGQTGHLYTAGIIFLILLPATLMMGATLPILIVTLTRRHPNIGWATGQLYSSNTLGAVLGTLSAGVALPIWLDLDEILMLSGALNILVASVTTGVLTWKWR